MPKRFIHWRFQLSQFVEIFIRARIWERDIRGTMSGNEDTQVWKQHVSDFFILWLEIITFAHIFHSHFKLP